MPKKRTRYVGWAIALAVLLTGLIWLAWPKPVAVDLAIASVGAMEVTIDDEAKTRVRHIYTVTAPVVGKVLRISHPLGEKGLSVHVGDKVTAAETVVALMQPTVPSFLDVRSREELQAMLTAADAALALAEAEVPRIEATLEFNRGELRRAEMLARSNTISERSLEKARLDVRTSEAALTAAKAQVEVRRSERASVAARLMDPAQAPAETQSGCCIQLRAPVTGIVLKIIQDNEAVVPAGAPLIDVGDPVDLEVIADLLSTDAVQIAVGAAVRIDGWGGPPVKGRVTRIDPAGFTKVSALGIEEQRVRTTVDFVDPPDNWSKLGHDYRVTVHITVWSSDKVRTVPVSALFRAGNEWAVFSVKDGTARLTPVTVGHRNNRVAEITEGLATGDRVVVHPSDRVTNGTRVRER